MEFGCVGIKSSGAPSGISGWVRVSCLSVGLSELAIPTKLFKDDEAWDKVNSFD